MCKLSLSLAAILIAFTCSAAPLYQQLPGHSGGFVWDATLTVADDFVLGQTTLIGGFNWWGGVYGPPPQDDFTFRLYSDNGGQPGSVLADLALGAVSKFATGDFVNAPNLYPEYEYSFTFSTPVLAQAGVRYWVSIVNSPINFWLWEASASPLNPGVQRSYDSGPWQPYDYNTAFELVPVPEPDAALFAAALGSLGLLAVQHRKGLRRA